MGQFVFDVASAVSDVDQDGGGDDAAGVRPALSTGATAANWLDQTLWSQAYLSGIEGVPFQTMVRRRGGRLTLSRRVESSAKLLISVWIAEMGYRTITTCSLRPNEDQEPYRLAVELARGSCMMVRNQADLWVRGGLRLSEKFESLLQSGVEQFVESALQRNFETAQSDAVVALATLQAASDSLVDDYSVQSIAFRTSQSKPLGTLVGAATVPPEPVGGSSGAPAAVSTGTPIGVTNDSARTSGAGGGGSNQLPVSGSGVPASGASWTHYRDAMNCMAIRMSWADIETDSGTLDFDAVDRVVDEAEHASMRIIAGPIIDFRARMLPHWLYLVENDFEQLFQSTVRFVERVVTRYRGRVLLWNAASALNTPGPLPLTDEQAMRMTVGILEAVRRIDPATATVMSFEEPMGEYLARTRDGISPMHFADAIARSGLGLSGFGLDYRMGYQDAGTSPRSPMDLGNSIDRWATLGMPLLVTLNHPGGVGADHQAISPGPVLQSPDGVRAVTDMDAYQLKRAGAIIRTLLAKPCVHGVLWDGWDDRQTHVHSHSGLIDASGRPRRLLDYFQRLRRDGVI